MEFESPAALIFRLLFVCWLLSMYAMYDRLFLLVLVIVCRHVSLMQMCVAYAHAQVSQAWAAYNATSMLVNSIPVVLPVAVAIRIPTCFFRLPDRPCASSNV